MGIFFVWRAFFSKWQRGGNQALWNAPKENITWVFSTPS